MKKIHSILVPTDFSTVALNAYRYALQLADALDANIDLMYTIPPATGSPAYGTYVDTLIVTLEKAARSNINDFLKRGIMSVSRELTQVPRVEAFVRVGSLEYSIQRHVEGQDNQLIVMGTAGHRSRWDDFLGTNASYLVGRSPCPLLIIPPNVRYHTITSLCFATDLLDVATFQVGRLVAALRPLRPSIQFLHVRAREQEHTDFDLDLLREVFDRPEKGLRATFADRHASDIVGAIFAYAFETNCQLVVMHRTDRPWFNRLLAKSNTSEAVLRARLPLLIITAHDLAATTLEPVSRAAAVKQ